MGPAFNTNKLTIVRRNLYLFLHTANELKDLYCITVAPPSTHTHFCSIFMKNDCHFTTCTNIDCLSVKLTVFFFSSLVTYFIYVDVSHNSLTFKETVAPPWGRLLYCKYTNVVKYVTSSRR